MTGSVVSAVVWVLDTSSIVRIKTVVPQGQQWKLFKALEKMVEEGRVAFPRHVRDEVDHLLHPDAPGVWAVGVYEAISHPTEPAYEFITKVMSSPAAQVVDPDKTNEDADPYVIALGLHLSDAGHEICVVTNDQKEHPGRISLSDACDHLGVPWCGLEEFLAEVAPST